MKPESVLPSSQLASQFQHIANFSRFWEQAQASTVDFDWEFYLNYYDDLQSLTTSQEAYEHWILLGQIEGRLPNEAALEKYVQQKRAELPCDFDLEGYWALNPDVRAKFVTHRYGKFKAFEHFLQHGFIEGRPYKSEFDWQFYREFHTDLAHLSTYAEAYDHWLEKGVVEGRFTNQTELMTALEQQQEELPADFNPETYLHLNPDLQRRFANSRYRNYQATVHFINSGRLESRLYSTHPARCHELRTSTRVQQLLYDWGISSNHALGSYQDWITENEPSRSVLDAQIQAAKKLAYQPLISIIIPVYNPPPKILEETIRSIICQTYENWELCLVDGASSEPGVREIIAKYSDSDLRIRATFLSQNLGISHNSNTALQMAEGEFVALVDHDDLLAEFALFEVAKFLNEHPDQDIIYSDEDKTDVAGRRHAPFFKPDWSPELLTSFMYVGHLTVYRRKLVRLLGGFRSEFDFSQDYDLILRATERTTKIGHIAKVLYHWRAIEGSAAAGDKGFARASNIAALADATKRRGYDADVIAAPTANRIKLKLKRPPLVSIVIPSDREDLLSSCIESLVEKTSYSNYEILVVTNSELGCKLQQNYSAQLKLKVVLFDEPYNFSAKCNRGAKAAQGKYVLFLNDDVRPIDSDWIETLLDSAEQDGVASVSPKLLYESGNVQYAGMVTGVRGWVGTAFHQYPANSTEYRNYLQSTRPVSILCGACALIRKDMFWLVGGFNEINTPIMGSDVELSAKLIAAGLRIVYTPFAELTHIGHASLSQVNLPEKGHASSSEADLYLLKRWGKFLSDDPYFTDNMRSLLYHDSPTRYRLYAENRLNASALEGDVLIVTHELTRTGAPLMMLNLATYLQNHGYAVTVISPVSGVLLETFTSHDIPVIIDPLIFDAPSAILDFLRSYRTIIASTVLTWNVVLTSTSIGQSVIWMIHEGQFGLQLAESDSNIQRALQLANIVLFPSEQTQRLYKNFQSENIHTTLHYGVKVERKLKAPRKIFNERIKVIQVGSIEHRKGQDITLKAIKSLPKHQQHLFEFYFVGRRHDVHFYNALVSDSNDLENVHWIDEVTPDEALSYIANSDIVVCASRDETGPIFVIEGMYFEKVIISTSVGVVPEVIEHRASGLLFDQEDHRGLAENLINICQDSSLRARLGSTARAQYEQYFQVRKYGESVINLIEAGD